MSAAKRLDASTAASMTLLAQGAEARIERGRYLDRAVLWKVRVPKLYRHTVLDAVLRDERTRDEASLLLAARRAGVPVPVLYDVDRVGGVLVMEEIQGPTLRLQLAKDPDDVAGNRMEALGAATGRLHAAGITHGDLTTSNVLVPDATDPSRLVLIDFGLGGFTQEHEPRGVDLHLVEEALEATDDRAAMLFERFLEGYAATMPDAEASIRRLEAIRERGRYR